MCFYCKNLCCVSEGANDLSDIIFDHQWCGVVVWLTSGLIWTGCRLVTLSWVPGSVLAIWEVACTTDLCWDKDTSFLKGQWHINFTVCLCVWAHFTCWAVCTCWTTCVGTPDCTTAGGGLESDTLSLEWREPSEGQRENSNTIINFTLMKLEYFLRVPLVHSTIQDKYHIRSLKLQLLINKLKTKNSVIRLLK